MYGHGKLRDGGGDVDALHLPGGVEVEGRARGGGGAEVHAAAAGVNGEGDLRPGLDHPGEQGHGGRIADGLRLAVVAAHGVGHVRMAVRGLLQYVAFDGDLHVAAVDEHGGQRRRVPLVVGDDGGDVDLMVVFESQVVEHDLGLDVERVAVAMERETVGLDVGGEGRRSGCREDRGGQDVGDIQFHRRQGLEDVH